MDRNSETVVESTISAIRDGIRRGQFAPGQRLVVADVTQRFGVSAGPVREAIRRLTGEGLIEITPHRGATVRELRSRDIREIFQLREVVEGLAARLAAENINVGDGRQRMEACVAEMRTLVANKDTGYVENNHAFHNVIYEIAGNGVLRETAERLVLPLYQLRYHYMIRDGRMKESAAEHEEITEAILEGEGALADRLMRIHVRKSGAAMLDAVLEQSNLPERGRRPRALQT